MRYGEGWEVLRTERKEFDGPAPEDKALIPGLERIRGD